jgi:asparagine synthetase B (glutamine-hydrolysing)
LGKDLLYSNSVTKIALRKLASKVLPTAVSSAPKQGFVPGANWMETKPAQDLISHYLSATTSPLLRFVPEEFLKRISGQKESIPNSRLIWPLFTLALWLERWA